ncbi:P-loop containing nucleoside triphosphate hydrolase protein [Pisolithus thermaeus]|nr:P-loop containing nucleoside triphosphate hydrolase protein [Pisolithus thermaeus]
MKPALHFDNADGFGEWRILIGTSAIGKLREFRRSDAKKFKAVYKKIKELSSGQFSDDNRKRLDGGPSGVPIFEASIPPDLMLVYQTDCVPDREGEVSLLVIPQVIKIYGMYTRTQLNAVWDAMSHYLSGRGEEYIKRCIFRNEPVRPDSEVYFPAVFPPVVHEVVAKPPSLVLNDQEIDQVRPFTLASCYDNVVAGLIVKNDVQHEFELTPQEREIVECSTSCYVLGRGGINKTKTMLFKMLKIQREWQLRSECSDLPQPRQVFVTKSSILANNAEEYFVKLLESLSLAGCTLEELERWGSRHVDQELDDYDDVPDIQSGIPLRYSELENHHFPLFLTFDRLARMIAADISDADDPGTKRIVKLFVQSHDPVALDSFVSYEVFLDTYWPHFRQNITKGRDPWLVFKEIIGIIKGSEKSLGFDNGALDRKTYCDLPSRSNPTLSGQRNVVYDIYEAYSRLKCQLQHHDVADRFVNYTSPIREWATDEDLACSYVDEVQDNLLIDALLLRLICSNPDGLFWAGDITQTIFPGNSFRFNDLKAFLYRIEVDQVLCAVKKRAVSSPKSFQLTINYRSHSGIVNCAHSVIDLISRFWPNSIDLFQPERGIVDGLKPVFFSGWGKGIADYEQFLFGASGGHIEFGAQQCILVRDEKAKEKLRQQVGDIGLIMTLYESMGLEFNDVLLYNFFEDSNVGLSHWRLVLTAIDGVVEGRNKSQVRAPCFERDENRYAGLCGELKLLYMGITRARKNMWIVDDSNKAEPMRLFWTSRSQIQNYTPEDLPHLVGSSTPEECAETGRSLFHHKRYTQAMHFFRRTNMPREARVAEAYHFRELARATVGIVLLGEQQRAFAKAAEAFVNCGNEASSREKRQYYRTAAECYARAANDPKEVAVGDRTARGQA